MFLKKSITTVLSSVALFMAVNKSHSDTLFYVPYDKNLEAEISEGKAAPMGADTAVISVFSETTKGNKGIVKNGEQKPGEALDLSGSNSNRSVNYEATSNFNTEQGTVQFWVKPCFNSLPMGPKDDSRNFLYVKTEGGQYNNISIGYRDWYYNGKAVSPILYFYINDGKHHGVQINLKRNAAEWEKDKWQHIMACWDKKSMRLYLNGKLLGKTTFNEKNKITPCPPDGPIEIGKTGTSSFPCLIDEVTIDNTPLFSEEATFFELSSLPRPEKKMSEGSQYYPTLASYTVATPPAIDGKLDESDWEKAVWTTGFASLSSTLNFVKEQTLVASCHDKDNLYMAFICLEPYMDKVLSEKRKKDGSVWKDESVEFFICPDKTDRQNLYQFIVSSSGSVFDGNGKYRDGGKWNGEWKAATSKYNDKWTVEMSIPWKTLEVAAPQDGNEIPFNAARNRRLTGGEESCIALVACPSYSIVNRYGNIKFVKNSKDAGTEESLNSFFTEKAKAICEETKSTANAQIKNCEFLWGRNPQIDALKEKLKKWNKLDTKILNECLQKYIQIPEIQAECFSVVNAIKEERLTKNILSPGKDEHVLKRKSTFVISKKNGVLLGVKDEQILSSSITDRFSFENRQGKKKTVSEWFDVILEGSLKTTENSLEGTFVNKDIPDIKIRKNYTLIDASTLSKKVEFIQETDKEDYKISGITEVALMENFRTGGIYSSYPSALGNKEKYIISADEIKKGQAVPLRVWVSTFGKALVNFSNKDSSKGLGQFQKKINGGFAYPPLGFEMTYLTSSGWQLSWFCGSLGKNISSTSSEACYTVFNGDRVNFHFKYKDIIELDKAWEGWSPFKWIGNVRWVDSLSWAHELEKWKVKFAQKEKSLRDTYEKYGRPGDVGIVLSKLTNRWGALPTSDDSLISYYGSLSPECTHKAGLYAKPYQELFNYPTLLVGIYMWPWGVHKGITDMEKKHPEWFEHNRDGSLTIAMTQHTGGATTECVPMFTPEYDEWWGNNCMGMLDYLKLRMLYTDGPLMTAPIIDWDTMKIRTQADGLKLAKLLWTECRKRNVLWFANDGYAMTPFKDTSWIESVETLLDDSDWKSSAEPFLVTKVYSHRDVPQFMLYWRESNKVHCSSQVILLGLRTSSPHFNCPREVSEAYAQLGQEMFGYRPFFPNLHPCYWTENTNIEAYALKRKGSDGVLLTFQNHNEKAEDITLSFNTEKSEIDTSKPVYAWYSNMRHFDDFKASPSTGLSRLENVSNIISVKGSEISITIKDVAPKTAKQLFITNNPVLVWAICGKTTLLKANSVINAKVKSVTEKRFEVSCERPATLLVAVPDVKIELDGKTAKTTQSQYGQLIEITPGNHTIELIKAGK